MENNDFRVLIDVALDEESSANQIKQQVKRMSNQVPDMELGVRIDENDIKNLRGKLRDLQKEMDSATTKKEQNSIRSEFEQTRRNLNAMERALNQQRREDAKNQNTELSRIASAQRNLVSMKRSQIQMANMENKEIEKQNVNLRQQKSLLSSMKTWRSKQSSDTMKQEGNFGIDVKSVSSAEQAYNQLIEKIASGNIKIEDAKLQFKLLKDVITQLNEASKNTGGVDVEAIKKRAETIRQNMSGAGKTDYNLQISRLKKEYQDLGFTQEEIAEKTRKLTEAQEDLRKAISSGDNNLIIQKEKERAEAYNQASNALKKVKTDTEAFYNISKQNRLSTDIQNWLSKNTKASAQARATLEQYLRDLNNGRVPVSTLDAIERQFKQIDAQQRGLGKLGKSLKDQFAQAGRSFAQWFSVSAVIMNAVHQTREALTELKQVNTELTEISKTNEKLTKSDLARIGDDSFDTASRYGKKATDYLSGVREASRAGYGNAEEIAELSTSAQGAGDMTADVANKYVIATDKAYKFNGSVKSLREVMDGANNITNNYATNMTELAEGMTIVGSTAASFGLQANQTTAALGTMIATTQQSGSEMARAFRAILLNIRQVSDEEEGIDAEGLTKYEKACNALNVKLKETKDGIMSMRDPMQVLEELSKSYNELDESDIRRTELLNSVGGKLRANALDALLRQWDTYKDMLQVYADGDNSMAREAAKTAASWEGVSNKLHNTWVDTVGNIAEDDAIIDILNFFNKLLSGVNAVTEALGGLGTLSVGAGIFAGVKNVGRAKCSLLVVICLQQHCFLFRE